MTKFIIGKSGERQRGAISMATNYKVAQVVTDADGNWWYSKKNDNLNHALPTTFNGVGTENEWWICVFDAKTYKAALAAYAQSVIDGNNQRATQAVNDAESALATAQQALSTAEDVQAAIDSAEAAAALANASVGIVSDELIDSLWDGYDFNELVNGIIQQDNVTPSSE